MRSASSGHLEVRALTWRRDCLNLIWTLKSFYHFSEVDYPLYIHDEDWCPDRLNLLVGISRTRRSFAVARLINRFARYSKKVSRCVAYRRKNPTTRKLFDFFLMSGADYAIPIDSDIVFFRKPELLCAPSWRIPKNLYNKDESGWYSMSPDELEANFGIRPPERINSGLSVIRRESIDFEAMEQWMAHPKLFADLWVTEQTLHALCSTVYGVEMLPETYRVSIRPGLPAGTVCKHYPGFFRPLLYEEGMTHLVRRGFLDALRSHQRQR